MQDQEIFACGIIAIHGNTSTHEVDFAMRFTEGGPVQDTYTTISGETFNVMYFPEIPDGFMLQPQTALNVLFPMSKDVFDDCKDHWDQSQSTGIDILVWNDEQNRPLVKVE